MIFFVFSYTHACVKCWMKLEWKSIQNHNVQVNTFPGHTLVVWSGTQSMPRKLSCWQSLASGWTELTQRFGSICYIPGGMCWCGGCSTGGGSALMSPFISSGYRRLPKSRLLRSVSLFFTSRTVWTRGFSFGIMPLTWGKLGQRLVLSCGLTATVG